MEYRHTVINNFSEEDMQLTHMRFSHHRKAICQMLDASCVARLGYHALTGASRSAMSLIFLVVTFFSSQLSQGMSKDYEREYLARRQQLITYFDTMTVNPNFASAAAKYVTGKDIPTANRFLEILISEPGGDMFFTYPLMGAYLYGEGKIPAAVKKKVRKVWSTYTPYRGDTENHWVMYYTALYLAAQTWPNQSGSTWFNGKSSRENFDDARGWLNHWMKTTTTIGQGEFDSPAYASFYLSSMFVLYEFAKDAVMKRKARMMIDYLLADFAVEYLNGMYCGGHSRDYPETVVDPKRSAMTGWGWLFFGQMDFYPRGEALFAAISSYRLPEIIYRIATDRSKPYVNMERKRVRNILRFGAERNPPVYKYDYMTKDYCLGSLHGGILQPIQQHTWDVTFVSDKTHCTLFTLHPYYSGHELAMFFPEEGKLSVAEVALTKTSYNKDNKWTSSSPYEQTFQYKNSIIVLYNIEPSERIEHIDGFFPKDLDERKMDISGWIFCRSGNTYIAYYPLKSYHWIEEDICHRLRSLDLKNGCVVEVASADDYPSFEAFQTRIRSNRLDYGDFDKTLTVSYTTSSGDTLQFTYNGKRTVNGKEINFADYKLFNSPFLQADVGSEKLTMRYGNKERVLDFKKVSIRERAKKEKKMLKGN